VEETADPMTDSPLWPLLGIPLLIFLARTSDVSLSTLRIILVSRGHRRIAPLVGFGEVLIWLAALTQVLQHLDRPINFLAYAGGFAAGTWVGMLIEERLALGLVSLRVIAENDASGLIHDLSEAHFGVTSFAARGVQGRVRLIFTVLRRRDLPRALELVRRSQPRAFISISDVREAREGVLPPARGFGLGQIWRKGK
jgi:uncharacterized protein YebE (UPF0316 family)